MRVLTETQKTRASFGKNTDVRVAAELLLMQLCEPALRLDAQALNARISRVEEQLAELGRRLEAGQGSFPHEIGLFLSYLPEDVLGFICNGACNHKCVGCWKVYGDVDAAIKKFESFESCTHRSRGKALDEIIQ